jgi:hypothetical protein
MIKQPSEVAVEVTPTNPSTIVSLINITSKVLSKTTTNNFTEDQI